MSDTERILLVIVAVPLAVAIFVAVFLTVRGWMRRRRARETHRRLNHLD